MEDVSSSMVSWLTSILMDTSNCAMVCGWTSYMLHGGHKVCNGLWLDEQCVSWWWYSVQWCVGWTSNVLNGGRILCNCVWGWTSNVLNGGRIRSSSVTNSLSHHSQRHMNQTASSKPKTKFSSRNLNAVFKTPLRTKPLPENVTRPLRRPDSRMLVLGRAAVAPPAPLNTPSIKREIQLHNPPVSLVPASSNWADNAAKSKAPEQLPEVDEELATATSAKIWTPESVATRLNDTGKTSGRWGDDAVDDDIIQHKIVRQRQQEEEFPHLKDALENTKICHRQPLAVGRAAGRWAHFNDEEMKQCFSQDNHWRYDHDRRDEDDRWCDTASGQESQHFTVPLASSRFHTYFSRSDVRFDMVLTSECEDSGLRRNSDQMKWNSILLHPENALLENAEGSCVHTPQLPTEDSTQVREALRSGRPDDRSQFKSNEWLENIKPSSPVAEETRSSTESSTYSSSSSSPSLPHHQQSLQHQKMLFDPKSGNMINARDMTRHVKRQTDEGSRSKDRESTQKLLDSKWEAQSKASTSSEIGKAEHKENEVAPRVVDGDLSAVAVATEQKATVEDTSLASAILSVAVESTTGHPDIEMVTKSSKGSYPGRSHLTMKQPSQQKTGSRKTRLSHSSRPSTSRTTQREEQIHSARSCTVSNRRESRRFGSDKTGGCIWRKVLVRHDQSDTERNELVQNVRDFPTGVAPKPETNDADTPMRLIAEESHVGEDKASDVRLESNGFETVKSRRTALYEKKQHREPVVSMEAKVDYVRSKTKYRHASWKKCAYLQSKGEEVEENSSGTCEEVSSVDAQSSSKPRAKAATNRRSNDEMHKKRESKCLSKPTKRRSGRRNKEVVSTMKVDKDANTKTAVNVRLSEQVAGEAPVESSLFKESARVTPAARTSVRSKRERHDDHSRNNSNCSGNEEKLRVSNDASPTKKNELSKPLGSAQSVKALTANKARAPGSANARPKQVRQVYVQKIRAPKPTTASV
ncbi:hypothetical protein PsorP6_001365 [Peronosclerospora sorghi]|uniref:Uncharacterized protein n=1 Tax=Peronosclerospora sorghi TaxID=230839 RepID=A0ACC0WRQ2_9STRA|nr:hypothetical protein PsorP6_001365 [Peronosclerospora sorghi]